MVCEECGKYLSESRTKCTYCGAPQPFAAPARKKKIKWVWAAAGLVLVLGAVVIVMTLLR